MEKVVGGQHQVSRGFMIAALLILLGTMFVVPGSALSSPPPAQLIVRPMETHAGGTIYLSGAGFPAYSRLALSVTCGNGKRSAGGMVARGPVTDAHGQFVAVPLQTSRLTVRQPQPCQVSARSSSSARSSATFTIFPATHPLTPCAAHICVTATAVLVRVRSGTWGDIAIRGWPGAQVVLRITPAARKATARSIRLDWQGVGSLRMWVAPGLKQALRAHLVVSAQLGRFSGNGTGTFAVMPGGR